LDGYKDVHDHGNFDVWGSTSTLYTYLRRGDTPGGMVLGTGILHLPPLTFVRQVATARVTGTFGGSHEHDVHDGAADPDRR
jgi:cholesterol oxidase